MDKWLIGLVQSKFDIAGFKLPGCTFGSSGRRCCHPYSSRRNEQRWRSQIMYVSEDAWGAWNQWGKCTKSFWSELSNWRHSPPQSGLAIREIFSSLAFRPMIPRKLPFTQTMHGPSLLVVPKITWASVDLVARWSLCMFCVRLASWVTCNADTSGFSETLFGIENAVWPLLMYTLFSISGVKGVLILLRDLIARCIKPQIGLF